VDFFRRPKSSYYAMKEKFAQWQSRSAPPIGVYGENLSVRVYDNRRLTGNAAAFDFIDRVNHLLATKETVNVIFATGASQIQFFEALVVNGMFVDWSRINAFHLDEYVGIGLEHPSGFARFLKDRIMDPLAFRQFYALDGLAADVESECRRYADLLNEREIDLACIGIGENGHIAFNDPPVANFDDPRWVKVVELDDACREQQFREGAFPDVDSVPRQAITLTIPAIMRAKVIHCVVPGAVKEIAAWKTLHAEISTRCPATILRHHPEVQLYLDAESAKLFYPAR
jgi:glucosamine-6-phosphate deaminase